MFRSPCRPLVAAGLLAITATTTASAAFVAPTTWTRGQTFPDGGAFTYQHWDNFSDDNAEDGTVITDGSPDVGLVNPYGSPVVKELGNAGAFITNGGNGNIYSFSGATSFEVTVPEFDVPSPEHHVTAIVQTKTVGTELDYGSVKFNGLSPVDTAELSRVSVGSPGGATDTVESWFLFNIPYSAFGDGVTGPVELLLTFEAAGGSMSLDQLSIDTAIQPGFFAEPNPVPEPTALAVLGLTGALTLLRRR